MGTSTLIFILTLFSLLVKCYTSNMKTYIVYTGKIVNDEWTSRIIYQNMINQVAESNSTSKRIIYQYKRSFSGFAAKLTDNEAHKIAGLNGVVSVFLSRKRQLLTTRSWDFIGLPKYVEREHNENDIIIGVIDSGIWPESESFNDKGYGPPPKKWKGTCQTSHFPCNNKIIGARYYRNEYYDDDFLKINKMSPIDTDGHGTHTASTAAGNPISMTSMLGLGQGTARGGASSARIAVYKACWSDACNDDDIFAAFDDAGYDGVDILSVSLGGVSEARVHFGDVFSVGSFHALEHGILTVFAAGNSGPKRSSITNFAPWAISVAASTIDRKFVTKLKLGDNQILEGISLNTFDLQGELWPIIYAGDAPNKDAGFNKDSSRNCSTNSLDIKLVKGKIVLCEDSLGSAEAHRVGAVGVLIQGPTYDTAYSFPLPASYLKPKDAAKVHKYIKSTRNPVASIYKTSQLNDTLAPMTASFSSRGPNNATPEILKPDLIAPGVDILASWSPIAPISLISGEKRKLDFNIVSGTSMSCPHVSGAAAFVKSVHPTWSPAAIRSALMTTAKQISSDRDAEFAYGAGQIDPIKALDPGLVYDANEEDYIKFLCDQGLDMSMLLRITLSIVNCSERGHITPKNLNYPSFAFKVPRIKHHLNASFKRIVTNVGLPMSTYRAFVTAPRGLNISVTPNVLSFTSLGEKQNFILTINGKLKKSIGSASLIWDNGKFQVRSPIVVFDELAVEGKGVNLYRIDYICLVIFNLLLFIIIIE
ncbi:cucumisin-like [Vicia villosa]|uniref:cucumisin-like n=1 Tax=Vicia villosa TaxID=3911 RepID=UPI00273C770D|nr:cucumisin-like [Vicia villosa]